MLTKIFLYALAVVAANVGIAAFGPVAAPAIAFLCIGATFTLRDSIHREAGASMAVMAVLLGMLCSIFAVGNAITLASFVAYFAAEAVDTVVFHLLRKRGWNVQVNGSNAVSSAVDSLLFVTLAFHTHALAIILPMWAAKFCGGWFWKQVLQYGRPALRRVATIALGLLLLATPVQAQQPHVVVSAQAGAALYPFNNYRPVANGGINALLFLPRGFSLLTVASRDLVPGARWVGIIALQWRLFAR